MNFSQARPVINPNDILDRADISINEYIPYFGFAYKRVQPNSGLELELGVDRISHVAGLGCFYGDSYFGAY